MIDVVDRFAVGFGVGIDEVIERLARLKRRELQVAAAGEFCANAGPRVDPGNPAGSILWAKVSTRDPPCGDPMPIAGPIPAEKVEQIRRWIERGAPND